MKLTDITAHLNNGKIEATEYGVLYLKQLSEWYSNGLLTQVEYVAISERLKERYNADCRSYATGIREGQPIYNGRSEAP